MSDLIVIAAAPVAFLAAVLFALWCHWLLCRLRAERCPGCGSRWRTELGGEWGGVEFWACARCGRRWDVRYPKEK